MRKISKVYFAERSATKIPQKYTFQKFRIPQSTPSRPGVPVCTQDTYTS